MSKLPVSEPTVTAETEPFWSGLRKGRVLLPKCRRCDTIIWYPRHFCPRCGNLTVDWVEATGYGVVYSYTTVRRSRGPYNEVVPYVVAYVELDEGPRVLTNLIDVVGEPRIGQRVTAVFDASDTGAALLRFRQASD